MMKKGIKTLIIVALILVGIGALLFLAAVLISGGVVPEETTEVRHDVKESFNGIFVGGSDCDIIIKKSDSSECYAVCDESERVSFLLAVRNDVLVLEEKDERRWFEFIGISFGSRQATLYLPEGEYGSLTAATAAGRIESDAGIAFNNAELTATSGNIVFSSVARGNLTVNTASGGIKCGESSVVYGDVQLNAASGSIEVLGKVSGALKVNTASGGIRISDMAPTSVSLEASSGNITLANVVTGGKLRVEVASGNIRLDRCDGGEIVLETSSGNVSGTLLSHKLFDTNTGSGRIYCPPSVKDGGKCTISTGSGNITIQIVE